MIQHGSVPSAFTKGTVLPIVKDSQGDMSVTSNNCGITLLKLPTMQMKMAHLLGMDWFGFKSKTSAFFTYKSTIDHFTML